MVETKPGQRRHFILEGTSETEEYRYAGGGGTRYSIPERDRTRHSGALLGQIEECRIAAKAAIDTQRSVGLEDGLGLQVEFESFPDVELAFESLARERQGIELLNVRHNKNRTSATVFVPDGKLGHFEGLIRDYLEQKRDRAGRPRDNRRLIDAIQQIRVAGIRALWTDDEELFPTAEEGLLWWEVWLRWRVRSSDTTPSDQFTPLDSFREKAEAHGMRVGEGHVRFPERVVLLVRASLEEMQRSIVTLNSIAELRRAKETAEFFDSLRRDEQRAWLDDLLTRTRFSTETPQTPYVCLLDTGVNRGHPLLAPALATRDLHSVIPGWGTDDGHGHGTEMAGLALTGNLTEILESSDLLNIDHRLESVKLLPKDGATGTDPHHHAYLTVEAVSRPEITAPSRIRAFGMAVTARDNRDRGRPSAWSAAVDSLAADVDAIGATPRLFIVSAGNVTDPNSWRHYPNSNDTDGVHDPAQAWNAVTVGAYTDLVQIADPDAARYAPIAQGGDLSPFSTTSLTWDRFWPNKPDIVLEGGNVAKDSLSAVPMPSLSLLTTHYRPVDRFFTTTNATSVPSLKSC